MWRRRRRDRRRPGPVDREPQDTADGLQGTLPVLDDVGVGALARVSEDDAQLFADAPSWTVIAFRVLWVGLSCRRGAPRHRVAMLRLDQ
jgi:hypothetical protein